MPFFAASPASQALFSPPLSEGRRKEVLQGKTEAAALIKGQ